MVKYWLNVINLYNKSLQGHRKKPIIISIDIKCLITNHEFFKSASKPVKYITITIQIFTRSTVNIFIHGKMTVDTSINIK